MDLYKKKSLKFSHELFSRDSRHAETLRARESSRFKRLSMIRSINDSDFLEDNSVDCKTQEPVKTPVSQDTTEVCKQHEGYSNSHKISAQKNVKNPMSRLEMLKKWKEEKLAKQELEKKLKKKPFTVGVLSLNSSTANLHPSSLKPPKSANNSKLLAPSSLRPPKSANNSKLLVPSFKQPKPPSNSKLAAPSSSIQPPRVPYNFKAAYSASKPVSGAIKCPSSMLKKPTPNRTASAVSTNKFTSAAKAVATVNKIGMARTNPASGMQKPTKIKENSSIKSSYQESSLSKVNFSRAPCKPVQKAYSGLPQPAKGIPVRPQSQVCSGLPKPAKGIPVRPQSQIPGSNVKVKQGIKAPSKTAAEIPESNVKVKQGIKAPSKPAAEDIPKLTKNVTQRSNLLFKKPIPPKAQEPIIKIAPASNFKNSFQDKKISKTPETKLEAMKVIECSEKPISEKGLLNSKDIENTSKQTASDPSIEDIPDVAFNCDVSLIRPAASFAPRDFKFQPPSMDFSFDDDPWEALHAVKQYLSRTSTPSKEPSDRISDFCVKGKDSIGMNHAVKEESNEKNLCQKTVEKPGENPNFKFSLSDDFLGMETADLLVNDEDADDGCDKNQNINEVVSYGSLEKKSDHKEMQNVPLVKKTPEKQICIDSCNKEISIDIISEPLVVENENGVPFTKGIGEEIAPTALLINEGAGESATDKAIFSQICGVTLDKSLRDNDIDRKSLQEVGKVAAELLLKETLKQRNIFAVSENNIKDNLDNSIECFIPEDFEIGDVKKIIESQMMLMKLEEEADNDDISGKLEAVNLTERKSTGSGAKRMSILKNVSVLKSIVETSELDESNIHSPSKSSKKHQNVCISRRSVRLSSQRSEISDDIKVLPVTKVCDDLISLTPRRSSRLHKRVPNISENDVFSPFKEKKLGLLNTTPRRSMRLIDLNTPEEKGSASCSKSNLSADFGKLQLSGENMNPNDFLIEFDSPIVRKPKKISLLYSPDRKSFRRSIKGDLMSFSPGST